jgi:alpha-tubulin suppressor-like RCC1 family protein
LGKQINCSRILGTSSLSSYEFTQKITTIPKLVKKLNKFVTMGFAATHYSLALSSDGNIYEWGM